MTTTLQPEWQTDRDSVEARDLLADAVLLDTKPTKPYPAQRVRLVRPAEVAPDSLWKRRCSQHVPRRCSCEGEYRWFWHPGKNNIFAVCPDCGRGYFLVGPVPKGMARASDDRKYNGLKARRAWGTYRAKTLMR
jgi:hypothetical protein